MTTRVGHKGQVVIERRIREQLGVRPGMIAVQEAVGDHVEIRFVPGSHQRSLAGAARPFVTRWPSADERDDYDGAWASEVTRHLPRQSQAERS